MRISDWSSDVCSSDLIDAAYFRLAGGIERWLYRLVRKHGGHPSGGWPFDFRHLHAKSGSQASYSDFALDLRRIAHRQSLPGHLPPVEDASNGAALHFVPVPSQPRAPSGANPSKATCPPATTQTFIPSYPY